MLLTILKSIVQMIFDSANAKTAVSAGVGSGLVALTMFEVKMADVKTEFKTQLEGDKKLMVEYVDLRHAHAMSKFDDILRGQIDMKKDITNQIQILDNRVYNLNQTIRGK